MNSFSFQRFSAYLQKEVKQIQRDPSTILIALVLPIMMIFLFGYGMSLDVDKLRIGIVLEDTKTDARTFVDGFTHTHYFKPKIGYARPLFKKALTKGELRGFLTVPTDFSSSLQKNLQAQVELVVDGSEPNTAKFIIDYATRVVATLVPRYAKNHPAFLSTLPIVPDVHMVFNEKLRSTDVFLPGSMAIILSLIGTLLTALVISREWERGTMEAIFATPIHISELLLAKLVPYFFLGLGSTILCVGMSLFIFGVPFRGSFLVLLFSTSIFLVACLAQGLLISSLTRNQFVSCQIAIMLGYLPAFILSGFVFEINSMPWPIQFLTYLFPPRYFVTILQSTFLSGTVWKIVIPNMFMMSGIALCFFFATLHKITKRLE